MTMAPGSSRTGCDGRHKPRAFVGNAQHPMELMGTHPLLAGTKQVKGVQPFVERNVTVRHDRLHGDSELFATRGAFPDAFAGMSFGCLVLLVSFKPVSFANYGTFAWVCKVYNFEFLRSKMKL
jgi:hypothetical protein